MYVYARTEEFVFLAATLRPFPFPLEGRGRITRAIKKCQKRKRIRSRTSLQKSISPSILHRRSHLFQATFQSGSSERERRKKLAFPPVPLTRTARSHGLSSRPSITSFPIPYPSGHTTLPFLRHRVYPRTRGFTRFEGGFKPRPRGFLARFPLHINCRRFGILCLPFFPSPALYSLCSTGGHDAGQQ